jgi:hypothetical protein
MNRAALLVSLALAVLSFAPRAMASDPFVDTIIMQLKLPEAQAPTCTLCHRTLIGGTGTVIKPFGVTVHVKYGVQMQDVQGLRSALTQMQANNDDSDHDGIGDIAELLQGTDPNVAEGGVAPEEARYGCYCSTARTRNEFSVAGAIWLSGLALSGWRRRARRERES